MFSPNVSQLVNGNFEAENPCTSFPVYASGDFKILEAADKPCWTTSGPAAEAELKDGAFNLSNAVCAAVVLL